MPRNALLDESRDAGTKKPPAFMQSREPKSIRYTPIEWAALERAARGRGLEPAVFARMLTMYALIIVQAPTFTEASAWVQGFVPEHLREPDRGVDGGRSRADQPSDRRLAESRNGTVKAGSI